MRLQRPPGPMSMLRPGSSGPARFGSKPIMARPVRSENHRPEASDQANHPRSLPDASPTQLIEPLSIQKTKGNCASEPLQALRTTGRRRHWERPPNAVDATGTTPPNDSKSRTSEGCGRNVRHTDRGQCTGGTPATASLGPKAQAPSPGQGPAGRAAHAAACEVEPDRRGGGGNRRAKL